MFCPQLRINTKRRTEILQVLRCEPASSSAGTLIREDGEKFSWNKTWLAEMFMSSEESLKHQAQLERLQGITPETKRLMEIKAGVITASVGLGLMILLYVLMEGIIAGERFPLRPSRY
jgi:hypothetical protein